MAGDYEVGYGKPPRHTRFRPGRSGNPAGRPKGPQTLPADLRAELEEAVTLREGELERTFSKQRAILRSLTAKAIEGDARATAMVLDLVQRLIGAGPAPERDPEGDPESDPETGAETDAEPYAGADPRERLAAKIARIHARLAAAEREGAEHGAAETPPEGPESPESGS